VILFRVVVEKNLGLIDWG